MGIFWQCSRATPLVKFLSIFVTERHVRRLLADSLEGRQENYVSTHTTWGNLLYVRNSLDCNQSLYGDLNYMEANNI